MSDTEKDIKSAEEYRDMVIEEHGIGPVKATELGWLYLISSQLENIEELLKEKSGNSGWDHSRTVNISAPDLSKLSASQIAVIEDLVRNAIE